MKKIFTLTTACIILCLVFASCKSNLSITKRHYNNGYYIAHSKGKQNSTASKEEGKIVQHKAPVSLYSIPAPAEKEMITPAEQLNNKVIIAAKTIKKENKIAPISIAKPVVNAKTGLIKYPVAKIKSGIAQNSSMTKSDDDDDDGLSLFWIVILVIVLLWAVGFLGGFLFGGLIHLLLLVALVFLILWLLHII
jgi:hypothetical protein